MRKLLNVIATRCNIATLPSDSWFGRGERPYTSEQHFSDGSVRTVCSAVEACRCQLSEKELVCPYDAVHPSAARTPFVRLLEEGDAVVSDKDVRAINEDSKEEVLLPAGTTLIVTKATKISDSLLDGVHMIFLCKADQPKITTLLGTRGNSLQLVQSSKES